MLAVVGAGNMGSGIAQKMATEGFEVTLVDVDDQRVARGLESIQATLADGVARKILTADQAAAIAGRVHGTTELADLADADLVVEAVFEDLAIKRDLFHRLDDVCRVEAILATNTSSFSVTELSRATRRPGRVLGLHYFYHPAKNRLVEVVPGDRTHAAVQKRAWLLQEALGKTPIASRDSYGFIVNRFFAPWLTHAIRIVEQGLADIPTVEAAARQAFGIGMGPFELMNVTGLPIALHTAGTLGRAFGPFFEAPALLRAQVESGQPWPLDGEAAGDRVGPIGDRLAAVVFHVAATLVDEGVGTVEDTDIGARVGLRWRRGPFELMNQRGIEASTALVASLADEWAIPVPALLTTHQQRKQPFAQRVVATELAGGIATLRINRPDVMNALNEQVLQQLSEAFRAAAADERVRGIVIAGSGKAFIAGADIRFFVRSIESGGLDAIARFTRGWQDLLRAFETCPKPVIARVQGMALGGGVELALACHAIVASPKASFAFPETGIGIYPGLGGTQRTTRRVGTGLARWLVLTGETLDASEALAIGLIDRVAPFATLDDAIAEVVGAWQAGGRGTRTAPPAVPDAYRAVADVFVRHDPDTIRGGQAAAGSDPRVAQAMKRLAYKAPVAMRIASELIDQGADLPIEAALELEMAHLTEIFSTKDAFEGLSSLGKKRPVFTGE
jgi:enoyl-CoA hydratase/3-hydroxyacyl-CoA dehydrogenase